MQSTIRTLAALTTSVLAITATLTAQDPVTDARTLASAIGKFGAKLSTQLPELQSTTSNSCLSPASASMALLMCLAGADGETRDQLAEALAPADWDAARIHDAAALLHARLQGDREGFQLASTQDVWLQLGRELMPGFARSLRDHYHSEAHLVDFVRNGEKARQTINSFVAEHTNDRIKDLLQPGEITPDTRLVLTNALYLNARWQTPFDPTDTNDWTFKLTDGSNIEVPFMRNELMVLTVQRPDYEVVRLPYEDQRFAMDLALPGSGKSTQHALTRLLENAHPLTREHITVALPRFSATNRFSLREALQACGIERAFSQNAQFEQMMASNGEPPLLISDVIQQTWLKVGEKGTEAAAATAAVLVCGAAIKEKRPRHVGFDRPFAFAIRDVETGLVLFAGCCNDPREPNAMR